MIAIEPAPSKSSRVGTAIRRRDLSRFLSCAAKAIGIAGDVSVLLTGDEQIRALNREYRGYDKATDVLSFPAPPSFGSGGHAGDLAISWETACRQAESFGHPLQAEVKILMLHGLLHLAGEDHEKDCGQMALREVHLRTQLGLPVGLIERGSSTAKTRLAASAAAKKVPSAKKTPHPRKSRSGRT